MLAKPIVYHAAFSLLSPAASWMTILARTVIDADDSLEWMKDPDAVAEETDTRQKKLG